MQEDKTESSAQLTPGAIITPQSNKGPTPPQTSISSDAPAVQPQEIPSSNVVVQDAQIENLPAQPQTLVSSKDGFSWTGPEFAQQDKPSSWYAAFIVFALFLGGAIYLLTKDPVSTVVVAVAVIVLGLYGLRKPKDITYNLSEFGLTIGAKSFVYEEFRSFTVTNEGTYLSITFLPLRRFATIAGLYYQGQDEDKIINFLSDRLPMEKHKLDIVDSIMQRIRF